MGFLQDLKFRKDCLLRGELEEYNTYIGQKKQLLSDIERFKKYVTKFNAEFENIKAALERGEPEPYKNAYESSLHEKQRWEYELYKANLQLEFIRPNSKEDKEYRDNVGDSFASQIKEVVSDNLDLRFHGTPLCFAKEILTSRRNFFYC